MDKILVLASSSPYRKELLQRLQVSFETLSPEVDETPKPHESPENLALRLASEKAKAVAQKFPNGLIIGSDQVAFSNGKIYGKPGNRNNAIQQLEELQGKPVHFFTALCLYDATTQVEQINGITTEVTFRQLSKTEIEHYVDTEQPFNCAGAAKSEGLGIALIEKITGTDPNALIGLPLIELCTMLKKADYAIL